MFKNNILKNKKILFAALALFIVITVAVVIIAVSVHNSDEANKTDEDATQANEQTNGDILSGDSTFLVVIENEANEIVLSLLADFKIYSKTLMITPLSEDTVSPDGRTYGESYLYGGINMLKNSVESVRNINIDRYAVINKSGFNRLTELMGEVSLYVEEDFSYTTSDKTYAVTKGDNDMGSDMLFTYISILAGKDNGEQIASKLISDIINAYLVSIDLSDAEDLFGDVTDCFSTDVTISDYYTAENDIEYLITNGMKCIIANDVDE